MTTHSLEQLPRVSPLMVRRFAFGPFAFSAKGGLVCVREVACEEVGLARERLEYDEAQVDCSFAVLEITTDLIRFNEAAQQQQPGLTMSIAYFNGRRWRSHRAGRELSWPDDSLLYIGNPVIITATPKGIIVERSQEWIIRSGTALLEMMELSHGTE